MKDLNPILLDDDFDEWELSTWLLGGIKARIIKNLTKAEELKDDIWKKRLLEAKSLVLEYYANLKYKETRLKVIYDHNKIFQGIKK